MKHLKKTLIKVLVEWNFLDSIKKTIKEQGTTYETGT